MKILLFAATLGATAAGATEAHDLNAIQSWQCRSSMRQGKFQAIDALATDRLDCVNFLTKQDEIVDLYLQASVLPEVTDAQLCFLEGFRQEIVDQVDGAVTQCATQGGAAYAAGAQLGYRACLLAMYAGTAPELVTVNLAPPASETAPRFLTFVAPVSSTGWREHLEKQTFAGSKGGCVLGYKAFLERRASSYVRADGSIDWLTAGRDSGFSLRGAICGEARVNVGELATALTGVRQGAAFEEAARGLHVGLGEACAE